MPKPTLALKATVTRRKAEPVDQPERQLQAEHHQAAENASQTAVEAATATPEPAPVPKAKPDPHALQSGFLMANLNRPVVIFLVNGLRLTGKLWQFDQYCLLLEGRDGIPSLVFKHAITTIAPPADGQPSSRD